jgi:hypothetical protein
MGAREGVACPRSVTLATPFAGAKRQSIHPPLPFLPVENGGQYRPHFPYLLPLFLIFPVSPPPLSSFRLSLLFLIFLFLEDQCACQLQVPVELRRSLPKFHILNKVCFSLTRPFLPTLLR